MPFCQLLACHFAKYTYLVKHSTYQPEKYRTDLCLAKKETAAKSASSLTELLQKQKTFMFIFICVCNILSITRQADKITQHKRGCAGEPLEGEAERQLDTWSESFPRPTPSSCSSPRAVSQGPFMIL